MLRTVSLLCCLLLPVLWAQDDLSSLVSHKCVENGGQTAADCYTALLTSVFKGVVSGKPDLAIPPLEPLNPGSLNVSVNAGSDQYRMNFLQPLLSGFGGAWFDKMRVDNPLSFVVNSKKITMKSPYVNSGRLIVIQASGGGVMSNTFDDVKITIKAEYDQPEVRDGKRYGKVKNCEVRFAAGTTRMRVEKLNSGNNIAKELYNIFLSASGTEIMALMLPQLNQQLADLFCDVGNSVLKELPLNAMFE